MALRRKEMPEEIQQLKRQVQLLESILFSFVRSDRFDMSKNIQMQDGRNFQFATGVGSKIGTATGQKLGFFNAVPVVQQTAITGVDNSTVDNTYGQQENDVITNTRTRVNEIETRLENLGLIAAN